MSLCPWCLVNVLRTNPCRHEVSNQLGWVNAERNGVTEAIRQ